MGLCDMNVHLPREREMWCPFDLEPVTSTAIQMGTRNSSRERFVVNHPAGRIGKSFIFKDLRQVHQAVLPARISDIPMLSGELLSEPFCSS
uniref:Probable arabinose 5-phosphate isomerase n=1 Tax=Nicotiana tabacum TaxID=4097 RepID=A0A1S3ZT27_TOBAC|nr:PREDICTED: probable arabinose 5-phosphate isomerase [Nicotiana tabacum]